MSVNGDRADDEPVESLPAEAIDAEQAIPSEREVSTTVGTGSYVAVSCTAMALLVTLIILAVLFVIRWIS